MSYQHVEYDGHGVVVPDRVVASSLRESCRDLNEIVRVLDSQRQSDMAGRLHALTVELRQLAAIAKMRADGLEERGDIDPGRDADGDREDAHDPSLRRIHGVEAFFQRLES